ncbi:TatA/E family twin arginine-targeting protein translocase [Synechococcus sp. RSCCF101]|uniref:TatA/E family twin arginine-targeting protein translocase n=1 Tax=Synechococcus sp. RSCCF101 TaxID=2511069 RepID=UPI001247794E|nr:TatA/E family twin arginine-targeting protein translocase [Synechococcus sp. RSCCF101]QEY32267.1 TatA/E family twin arginine-targeting protein translocase [Synechococcus sp. RSCCF101]
MSVFGVGVPEMAVIAGIGLLVFGPRKLPELGRTLGKTLRGFQSASREFEQEFSRAMEDNAPVSSASETTSADRQASPPSLSSAEPPEPVPASSEPSGGGGTAGDSPGDASRI